MKKAFASILPMVIAVSLLSGCVAPSAQPRPTQEIPTPSDLVDTQTVFVESLYSNASIELPAGWNYEIDVEDKNDLSPSSYGDDVFEIEFWPAADPDFELSLIFFSTKLGICGTGVTSEDISFPGGLKAVKHTEKFQDDDGEEVWFLLSYKNTPGCYQIEATAPQAMFDKYQEDLYKIFASAILGKGVISEQQAISAAGAAYGGNFTLAKTAFDYKTGLWTVEFYSEDASPVTVTVDSTGEVI